MVGSTALRRLQCLLYISCVQEEQYLVCSHVLVQVPPTSAHSARNTQLSGTQKAKHCVNGSSRQIIEAGAS